MTDVSIVIPCLNEHGYIANCLASLRDQNLQNLSIEVFVVDGMSTDGTREVVSGFVKESQVFQLLDNPARVTPVALNLGIKASTAPVVIILGAHATVHPDFVHRNISALQSVPDAGCVGGLIQNIHENRTAEIISRAMSSPFGVGNATFRTGGKAGYVDTVAFGAYRKKVFDDIGLFDERLVRNQDDELNFRLTRSGWKIWFDPEIKSHYHVRASYQKLFRQYKQYGFWKVYVNRLHSTITTWRQTVPFLFVVFLLFGAILSFFSAIFLTLWLIGMMCWLAGACAAAVIARTPVNQFGGMILSLFLMHFGYGWGYAIGIIQFYLLGRNPDTFNPNITR